MLQEDKEILKKYINDQANVSEQARVEKMFDAKNNSGINAFMKNDWDEKVYSEEVTDKDLEPILDKVHHAIHLKEHNKKLGVSKRIYRWYSTAAAVLLLPIVVLGLLSIFKLGKVNQLLAEKTSEISIMSPLGTRSTFELPDGSEIVLNSGSSVKYKVPFSNNRDVELIGEAYFDVVRNEDFPFVVSTGRVDVKVLGTKFNVVALEEENDVEVVLEEGKVECLIGELEIMLQPNDRMSLVGNKYEKTKVNASKYTAWRNGKLIFRGDSMNEVAKRISRWYNVDVEIKGDELNFYSFRATFQDDPLEEVLRLLKLSSPIDYKIIARKKQHDGTFTKKKILIYKKN